MNTSYKKIIKATSISGAASIVNILIGILRLKVAAVYIGPSGIGIIGILQNVMSIASSLSSVGLGTIGTKKVAEAASNSDDLEYIKSILFLNSAFFGLAGAIIFYLVSPLIDKITDSDTSYKIYWLSIGIAFNALSFYQNSILNGLRKIEKMALIGIVSAIASSVVSCLALFFLDKEASVIVFVLSVPVANFLTGFFAQNISISINKLMAKNIFADSKNLVKNGILVMAAGISGLVAQICVRYLVKTQYDDSHLGYYQAAYTISVAYVGFLLNSMGVDYYPRLAAAISKKYMVEETINRQQYISLLLISPVIIFLLSFNSWIVELLYSKEFKEAHEILMWQAVGDLIKISAWCIGFVLLSIGNGRVYFLLELFANTCYVFLTWLFLNIFGLVGVAFAYIGMYVLYIPLSIWIAKKYISYKINIKFLAYKLIIIACAITINLLSVYDKKIAAIFGIIILIPVIIRSITEIKKGS